MLNAPARGKKRLSGQTIDKHKARMQTEVRGKVMTTTRYLIICTAATAMVIFVASKVLITECDWATKNFWKVVKVDVARIEHCIAVGSKSNARDWKNNTPLHNAAQFNETPEILDALIHHGAWVNARNKNDDTPLHNAAKFSETSEIIDALIRHGADVNAKNKADDTPLHNAAGSNENPEIIDTLIRHGAEVNARNEEGYTPLHLAAWFNKNPDIIDALLDSGANPKLKNKDGKTAFDLINEDSPLHGTDAYWRLRDEAQGY